MRIFLILLACSFSVFGEDVAEILQSNFSQQKKAPDPTELEPGWWEYFNVNKEEFELRSKQFEALLQSLVSRMEPSAEKESAERLVKQIQTHLQAIFNEKREPGKGENIPLVLKESYTLDEYLIFLDSIRLADLEYKKLQSFAKRKETLITDLSKNLSGLFLNYQEIEEKTAEKVVQGLSVINEKSRIAYLEFEADKRSEEISLLKETIIAKKELVDLLEKRVSLSSLNLSELESDKNRLRDEYREAHRRYLELEARSVKVLTLSDEESPLSQEVLGALVQATLIQVKLDSLHGKELLAQMSTSGMNREMEDELIKLREANKKVHEQLLLWEQIFALEVDSFKSMNVLGALSGEVYRQDILLEFIEEKYIEKENAFRKLQYYSFNLLGFFDEYLSGWVKYPLIEIGGAPITLLAIFKATLAFLVVFWVSATIRKAIRTFARTQGQYAVSSFYLFSRVLHYFFLCIGILVAFSMLGLTVRNIAIILGALGLGIGFGLQNIVSNFVSGLVTLFTRSLKIGDYVELETGQLGKVKEINIQNATIRTFDGVDIVIPNAEIVSKQIVNWTRRDPFLRVRVPFGVAYGSDPIKVKEVVAEAAKKVPSTITNRPQVSDPEVWMTDFGESSLNFQLVVWVNIHQCRGRSFLRGAYLAAIHEALLENGINIPFPQRDLHIKTTPDQFLQH